MRRRLALVLLMSILAAGCGSSATSVPTAPPNPTPAPSDIFSDTPAPSDSSVPAASEAPTSEPSIAPGTTTYTVKKGDTMWAIAKHYGITVAALRAANPKVNPNAMKIGTVLVIPAPVAALPPARLRPPLERAGLRAAPRVRRAGAEAVRLR